MTGLIVAQALAALSVAELIIFSVPAIVGYRYLGQVSRMSPSEFADRPVRRGADVRVAPGEL